ncbi:putative ketoacyl reductase [Oceaniovalibus guishaninsula JLT2003]|uniref:Putative ketoacyl reductase n=1 Tax=Oceaniovalibus guishaninsula JLT2003 TaxID=1231392 RepID=K2H9R5_9RHOB|nr:SDR family oxidoreductase [Oceaniovalibus guishaninsula]EKE44288.1 putative ketoacyl reductase [Oceaniovalibus guishaninsula JLT2003]
MDLQIGGKTALVTGASGGMGLATAKILAEEGVTVLMTDMDADKVAQAASEVPGGAAYMAANLTDSDDVAKLADFARKNGGVDILVHTAGTTGAKGDPLEMTDDDWYECWNVDFMTAVRMTRALVPAMIDKGWGRVVCVTSENAVQPYVDEAVYNTAKAALLNFVKGLSQSVSSKGVLVNAVSPAFIETPMTDGMMDKRADKLGVSKDKAIESFLKEERPFLRLGRRGKVDEVASVIAMLCSDRASFTTGSAWRVDGGSVGTMSI